uniref:Uncharacterized protein n=1 Tax=Arundo donax TaxID=35708 RepID=A0A0A9FZX9_ARUDO
MRRVELGSWLS